MYRNVTVCTETQSVCCMSQVTESQRAGRHSPTTVHQPVKRRRTRRRLSCPSTITEHRSRRHRGSVIAGLTFDLLVNCPAASPSTYFFRTCVYLLLFSATLFHQHHFVFVMMQMTMTTTTTTMMMIIIIIY